MAKEPVVEDIRIGEGRAAGVGDVVRIRLSIQLSRGDWVLKDDIFEFRIGARTVIPGLEKGVVGMKPGGQRRISFGPHLGYRDTSIANIPAKAKLICHVDMLSMHDEYPAAG